MRKVITGSLSDRISIHDGRPNYQLACMEVWGGNHRAEISVDLPGLPGWIYSHPLGSAGSGGDVHYLSVCAHGVLTRIALADVAGHGKAIAMVAERLRRLMEKHINTWDQTSLMQDLNEGFKEEGNGAEYATAAVLGYYCETGDLVFTNAGHLPTLWYRAEQKAWNWLPEGTPHAKKRVDGLPLGLIPGTAYTQSAVHLGLNDLLILYTDGITEVKNEAGVEFGRERLFQLAHELTVESPSLAGHALLDAVQAFRGGTPWPDDRSLMVFKRIKECAC